ncbi:DUF1161 domain-containing protein [Entomomonas moraniae]|uniref:DUF1161 domain-containing protein n=1 Tax=Entomomonas moraniae TaxID=2213226 RepID=A0A3Q9JLJ5_9GAMM|nr:DUF1161 domain-containing protein [Entomomonas moraniae]AZS52113.1 DUF1161 domain-containing protein [Entomomonas moraniae]
MTKFIFLLCFGLFFVTFGYANNCPEIKDQIAEKIKANGVAEFSLQDVDKGTTLKDNQKIVGVCGGGTKDIVYQRGASQENSQDKSISIYSNK